MADVFGDPCGPVAPAAGCRLLPMKPFSRLLLGMVLICTTAVATAPTAARAETIRPAAYAGRFYPGDPVVLRNQLADFTRAARRRSPSPPPEGQLRALVLPHAGYVYAGPVAAHAGRVLRPGQFKRVIVLAPDHHVGFHNGVISAVTAYETPLGRIPIDPAAAELRSHTALFDTNALSDRREHALEVVLPYLQYYLQESFTLIPIVLGPTDERRMADVLMPLLTPETLLVISSDLSHFLPYDAARHHDRETLDLIMRLEGDRLRDRANCVCGKSPLQVLLHFARRVGWQPHLLNYANSGDTAGDRQKVVGYATLAFFRADDKPESHGLLKESQGQTLVVLARHTLQKAFGEAPDPNTSGLAGIEAACFDRTGGTFVTLEIDGALRGCIGDLDGRAPLRDSVPRHALQAAFRDPRFLPLKKAELDRVRISVSVLTSPQPLSYRDPSGLLQHLSHRRDGVIIRKGGAQATYLPQVWDQLPDPARFLSALCRKAGLAKDAWRRTPLEVRTYQAQVFHEQE